MPMPATEAERHELHNTLATIMGAKSAQVLLSLVPPDWTELATKNDLTDLRLEIKADLADHRAETKSEFADFRTEMHSDFADFRTEIHGMLADHRAETQSEFAAVRADMAAIETRLTRRFTTLLLTTQAATVAVLSVVVGVLA